MAAEVTARIWTCSHCGKREHWQKDWRYPVGLPEWPACSEACLVAVIQGWACTDSDTPLAANVLHLRPR